MRRLLLIAVVLWPVVAQAQTRQQNFDAASLAGVLSDLGFATWQASQQPDRAHALLCEGLRVGTSIGAAELTKRLIHERRPDGSDEKSFYSEHTTIAAAAPPTVGWSVGFSIGVGLGRVLADKHHPWDVAVGAGAGLLTHRLCQ